MSLTSNHVLSTLGLHLDDCNKYIDLKNDVRGESRRRLRILQEQSNKTNSQRTISPLSPHEPFLLQPLGQYALTVARIVASTSRIFIVNVKITKRKEEVKVEIKKKKIAFVKKCVGSHLKCYDVLS